MVLSAGFEPGYRGGGPIRSVTRLVDDYAGTHDVLVVTLDRDLGAATPYAGLSGRVVARSDRVSVYYMRPGDPRHWLGLARLVAGRRIEVLYLNSFFSPMFSLVPQLAARLRLIRPERVVVAPRGELMRGALALKPDKKARYLALWNRHLGRGVTAHATSDIERAQIADALPAVDIVLVEPPPPRPGPPPSLGSTGEVLRACFVGRISPKKNLMAALRALQGVQHPVRFDVYGPREDAAYWARCEAEIARVPAAVEVRYAGELAHEDVDRVFADYDAFVFPTLGENYGHVIAESLANACPVVLGAETPWSDVIRDGGGWLVDAEDEAYLTTVLDKLAAMSAPERMSHRRDAREALLRHLARSQSRSVLDVLASGCAVSR